MHSERLSARARVAACRIGERLSPAHLVTIIDEPIEQAAMTFHMPAGAIDQKGLLDTVAAFVQHLYNEAFPKGPHLTAERARDEAFALLNRGGDRSAYISTVIAVTRNPDEELPLLLWQISESLKARKRQEYRNWVLACDVDGITFDDKLALAKELRKRIRPYWPPHAVDSPIELLAASLEKLIEEALALDLLGPENDAGGREA